MSSPLIQLSGVTKHYPAARTTGDRLRGLWYGLVNRPVSGGATVLEAIDLNVHRGEAVAILGENGAGKSTLLKIVAGVIRPTAGSVAVNGRVGALLELGAGFHPEFSGRQNVRTAATLAALDPREIDSRMADIIEFAELGAAIDQPVKHYSSGMAIRLGFAVITAVHPDILISDEVLAVGDESFQKKCIRWLEAYLAEGGTLLLVSHSIYHVQKLCRRALWLHQGRIHNQGDVFAVTQAYLAHHEAKLRATAPAETAARRIRIECLRFNAEARPGALQIASGGELEIEGRVHGFESGDQLTFLIRQSDGALIFSHRAPAQTRWRLKLGALPLLPGHYQLELQPTDSEGRRCGDRERRLLVVHGVSREFGSLRVLRRWS